MEFNAADSQDNVNALGIAHWIFLPPTVNALKKPLSNAKRNPSK